MARLVEISLFFLIPVALIWYIASYGFSHIYDVEIDEEGLVFTLFRYIRIGRLSSVHEPEKMKKLLYDEHKKRTRKLLLTGEIELPSSIEKARAVNGIFLD